MDKKMKILIADDNVAISRILELKMRKDGFEVKTVSDGKAALDTLDKEKFDLLVLDLMMPELDGFGVLENLKQKGMKVPVIVASYLSQPEDVKKVKELGAVDFFVKSDMSIADMIERIKKYLKA